MATAFDAEKFKEVTKAFLNRRWFIVVPNALAAVVLVAVMVATQGSSGISEVTGGIAIASVNAVGFIGFSFINAIGFVAFGYVNTVGIVSLGLVGAVGIIAVGGSTSLGVIAISGVSAVGVIAVGRNAVGVIAIGVVTEGVFCLSLSGKPGWFSKSPGRHVLSPDRQDSKAVELFTKWIPELKSVSSPK